MQCETDKSRWGNGVATWIYNKDDRIQSAKATTSIQMVLRWKSGGVHCHGAEFRGGGPPERENVGLPATPDERLPASGGGASLALVGVEPSDPGSGGVTTPGAGGGLATAGGGVLPTGGGDGMSAPEGGGAPVLAGGGAPVLAGGGLRACAGPAQVMLHREASVTRKIPEDERR